MSKQHFNFKSSIRDWYIRAFPSDQIGYRINPLATFAGAVKCMADGGDIYKYLGVGGLLVRENVFSKIAAITGVDYDAVYDLWLHHDEDECSRLVFLGDHPTAPSIATGGNSSMRWPPLPSKCAMTRCLQPKSIARPRRSIRSWRSTRPPWTRCEAPGSR